MSKFTALSYSTNAHTDAFSFFQFEQMGNVPQTWIHCSFFRKKSKKPEVSGKILLWIV